MSGTAKSRVEVTTSDEQKLKEALSASSIEREQWLNAIGEELASLEDKATWVLDDSPKSQTLPKHVFLKVKRDADNPMDRFRA